MVESSEDSDEGTWHPQREESSEDEEEEEEEVDDEVPQSLNLSVFFFFFLHLFVLRHVSFLLVTYRKSRGGEQ